MVSDDETQSQWKSTLDIQIQGLNTSQDAMLDIGERGQLKN